MERPLDQPNFPLAVRSLETLTEQVARCQNLPAVDGGLRLMQVLEEIRNEMRDIRNEMRDIRTEVRDIRNEVRDIRNEMQNMNGKLEGLDRRMTVAERNAVARMENSSAMRPHEVLVPLYSLQTGDEIPGCPSTMEQAGALPARDVDRILRQLGASAAGSAQERRRRLLLVLGVATRAV